MPLGRFVLITLLSSLMGCAGSRSIKTTSAWLERIRPFRGPSGPEVVLMEVVLLERPIGDFYINDELWNAVDEQTIPLERKAVLEDNGLRVGQLSGITPARLQKLLTSETSCANPRRIQSIGGTAKNLIIGSKRTNCRFELHQDGQVVPITLDHAECRLTVVPRLTDSGQVRLQFIPVVRHGEAALMFQPAADETGAKQWALREDQPSESFSSVSWELCLSPNEYAVIGARADRPKTLGQRFFVGSEESLPVQRVLVIRTVGTSGGKTADLREPHLEDDLSPRSPPLALQAAWTTGP